MPGVITVDVKDALRVFNVIERNTSQVPSVLRGKTTQIANSLIRDLNDAAPSQQRTDPRHPIKLNESFYLVDYGTGSNERTVGTQTPQKLSWVTLGTAPHEIHPLFKQALWWPGLSEPVSMVFHPGTQPNDFVEQVFNEHDFAGDTQQLADTLAVVIANTAGPSMSKEMDFEGSNSNWRNYT